VIVGGPDLTIERSAEAATAVVTLEELFPPTGSGVADVTVAWLVSDAVWAGAVTVTEMVGATEPAASAERVHATETLPLFVHVHPVPDADTNVMPVGSVSATLTLTASDGPLLVITSVYVTDPAAVTVGGPDLTMARSADADTDVSTLELLLPGTGSAVVEATAALLDKDVACTGAVTITVIPGAADPAASASRVHVTVTLPLLLHDQPVPDAYTNVTPAGRVSVTTRLAASDGPLLATDRV
jgi:hypothetical protein